MEFDVFGLGNALVDALVVTEDGPLVERHSLRRGTMHLVTDEAWRAVYNEVPQEEVELHPGGSSANSICTVGLLGGRATFCGLVGDDGLGKRYGDRLSSVLGDHYLRTRESGPTGKCLSVVSPEDAERTMLTDLGTSMQLLPDEVPLEAVGSSKWLHLTGYLFTGGSMGDAARAALDHAVASGTKISFDVADPFVIEHFRDSVEEVVKKYADVVFMNEEEARLLVGQEGAEALEAVGRWVDIAVVKLGARGSLVRRGGATVSIKALKVDAVDTTGAGDSYAGGFLYGLTQNWDLEVCGRLASAVAGLTVSQIGGVVRDPALLRRELEAL